MPEILLGEGSAPGPAPVKASGPQRGTHAPSPGEHAVVTVKPVAGGAELAAVSRDGQRVTLRLDAATALTLADQLTMACERPLRMAV